MIEIYNALNNIRYILIHGIKVFRCVSEVGLCNISARAFYYNKVHLHRMLNLPKKRDETLGRTLKVKNRVIYSTVV